MTPTPRRLLDVDWRAAQDARDPLVGLERAEPEAEGRRLAGAVRTEHGEELARPDREREAVERQALAVAPGDAREFGDGRLGEVGGVGGAGGMAGRAHLDPGAPARNPTPVQQLAEEGRPNEEVIAREQNSQRDGDDRRELDRPRKRQVHDQHLQAEEDRRVDEVEPVGGVGKIAADGALRGAEADRSTQEAEGPGPDGECVAGRVGPAGRCATRKRRRRLEKRRRADDGQAGQGEPGGEREVRPPLACEDLEEPGLAMEQPAERESGAVGDERRELRRQAVVGSGNPEPDRPRGGEVEHCGGGQSERERRHPIREGARDPGVDPLAQATAVVDRRVEAGAQDEDERVEKAQVVEKPEMEERKAMLRQRGGGGGLGLAGEGSREAPDDRRDGEWREDHPAGRERHEDPPEAVLEEPAQSAPVVDEVPEEARKDEEEAHAEEVNDVEGHRQRHALRAVARRDDQKERHRRVQDDAEQQRQPAGTVHRMKAAVSVHQP